MLHASHLLILTLMVFGELYKVWWPSLYNSPASSQSSILCLHILLGTLFPDTFDLCVSFRVTDQVSFHTSGTVAGMNQEACPWMVWELVGENRGFCYFFQKLVSWHASRPVYYQSCAYFQLSIGLTSAWICSMSSFQICASTHEHCVF
jgi:hypothetical protein